MAAIQSIRNRGTLIAVVIGFSLLAFLLGDISKADFDSMTGNRTEIAEIGGKSIQNTEYEERISELTEINRLNRGSEADEATSENIRREAWDDIVKTSIMTEEYNNLGLAVHPDEVYDMVQGKNIDPTIRQAFTDPQTGNFDAQNVVSFLKNMDQDKTGVSRAKWMYLENMIITNRHFSKYTTLISKGLYVTTKESQNSYTEKNYKADIKFVALKYATVPDSTIKVTESELNEYYDKHQKEYEQKESRDIAYLAYDVVPSGRDRFAAQENINQLRTDFETAFDNKAFVNANSDTPFDEKYYKKGELAVNIDTFAFYGTVGQIYGPFAEGDDLKVVKINDIKMRPDTVKASHILLKIENPADSANVLARADSLKQALKKGSKFDELAMKFSTDQGSSVKGGDLGWFKEGQMVKEFNDACFDGKKGDIVIVKTQFGVHIISIVDKGKDAKRVQVAILDHKVIPSQLTRDSIYTIASVFASQNPTIKEFENAVTKGNMLKKIANNLTPGESKIAGLENARMIIRNAYKAEKDNIILDEAKSAIFDMGDKFVVAYLTQVRNEGVAPLELVKTQVEMEVRKEKKVKQFTDKMTAEIAKTKNMEQIAVALGVPLESAQTITFASFSIPNAGVEPAVIAAASILKQGVLSVPLKGNNGVFLIEVTNIAQPTPVTDYKEEKDKLTKSLGSRANFQAYESLKEVAKIKDKRYKFY